MVSGMGGSATGSSLDVWKFGGNAEAETGAAVFPGRGGIGLREKLKNEGQLFRVTPMPVSEMKRRQCFSFTEDSETFELHWPA